MNAETLIPIATTMGGGFFIGTIVGYFVKKIIKLLMLIAGGIVGIILYLQQQQIISLNIEKLEHSLTLILNLVFSSFDNITQIGDTRFLGLPMVGSISAGFAIGLMKG